VTDSVHAPHEVEQSWPEWRSQQIGLHYESVSPYDLSCGLDVSGREIQARNDSNAVDRVLQPLDGFTSAASGVQYVHSLLEAKGRYCGQNLRSREFVEAPKLRGIVPPRRIVKKVKSSGFCVRHRRSSDSVRKRIDRCQ
jgi:hypothetical protein